jgi:hypothetical protein
MSKQPSEKVVTLYDIVKNNKALQKLIKSFGYDWKSLKGRDY